ncbi:MAG: flagellar biosynthesis anti-sigma factor FlgM [Phycisphaerae bacterium]
MSSVQQPARRQAAANDAGDGDGEIEDIVEISDVGRLMAKVDELPEVRTDLVNRVKAEIAAGTYETPERLEKTVDGLMADLFGE